MLFATFLPSQLAINVRVHCTVRAIGIFECKKIPNKPLLKPFDWTRVLAPTLFRDDGRGKRVQAWAGNIFITYHGYSSAVLEGGRAE